MIFTTLSIVVMDIRQRVLRKKRKKRLEKGTQKEKIETLSAFLRKIYEYAGYKENNLPTQYAVLFQKYWFGGKDDQQFLEKEIEQLREYTEELERYIVKKSNWKVRIKMHFLL